MKLKTQDFQEACRVILGAIDNKTALNVDDKEYNSLELIAEGKTLYLNASKQNEYFVSVKLALDEEESLHATVDAKLFLKLVSKINTKTIELEIKGNSLVLSSNGTYKFPMKYINDDLVTLHRLNITNPTANLVIDSSILNSILKYNAKDLESSANAIKRPTQSLFYIDQDGCITWTETSVCVNDFNLSQPIKVFLNEKVVKLFKLFKTGEVNFILGFEEVGARLQTRVRFRTDDIDIVSVAENGISLMNAIPVDAIRRLVNKTYEYSVNVDTEDLISAIQRLLLFNVGIKNVSDVAEFKFDSEKITINKGSNNAIIYYDSTMLDEGTDVTRYLSLEKMKQVLENSEEPKLTMNFGSNDKAITLAKGNIKNAVQVEASTKYEG